jgi:hypothetical protein
MYARHGSGSVPAVLPVEVVDMTKEQRSRDSRRFQKGSGVFECKGCGARTRASGTGNESARLCPKCYAQALAENSEEDDG